MVGDLIINEKLVFDRLPYVVQREISRVKRRGKPVAFDNFDNLPSTVISLINKLIDSAPIWIVTRSVPAQGLGKIGEHFNEFAHLEVPPLKRNEIRILLEKAADCGTGTASSLQNLEGVYRLCRGNPRMLEDLLRGVFHEKR